MALTLRKVVKVEKTSYGYELLTREVSAKNKIFRVEYHPSSYVAAETTMQVLKSAGVSAKFKIDADGHAVFTCRHTCAGDEKNILAILVKDEHSQSVSVEHEAPTAPPADGFQTFCVSNNGAGLQLDFETAATELPGKVIEVVAEGTFISKFKTFYKS